ncbi:hypothetical protein L596_024810 [Steinernema carpocapsae]|uniref:Uncharacterized protein n=1 Tax=Steinernema carpocapsae TaxID=34508 RepID=A0A4U5M5V9_STECR|nr:hypothetical protein L596_024810 [Steinernema carpocapsae]
MRSYVPRVANIWVLTRRSLAQGIQISLAVALGRRAVLVALHNFGIEDQKTNPKSSKFMAFPISILTLFERRFSRNNSTKKMEFGRDSKGNRI